MIKKYTIKLYQSGDVKGKNQQHFKKFNAATGKHCKASGGRVGFDPEAGKLVYREKVKCIMGDV